MIRIAYIIDVITSPMAGTEKQLLMLMENLDRTRFEPMLICLRDSEWLREQSFSFEVQVLNLNSIFRPSFFSALSRFLKLHRHHRFDIVQTFFVDANVFGTIAAHLAGIKNIVSSRRNVGHWQTWFYRIILSFLRRWTPYYIANSRTAADTVVSIEGVDRRKITVIHNGLDVDTYSRITQEMRRRQRQEWCIADNERLVGMIANLRPVKNVEALIKAAHTLRADISDLQFVVVGEGSRRKSLEDLIRQLDLDDRFHLVGSNNKVAGCLAAFDIAVLCSSAESFSNSLLEYMAAGLPIVASNVGGNAEAIDHKSTGRLYAPENDDGLADELRELLTDMFGAHKLGAAAREAATARYSIKACVKTHQEYYIRIASREV